MKNSTRNTLCILVLALPVAMKAQVLTIGLMSGVNQTQPILDWNNGIIKEEDLPNENKGNTIHIGATGKLQAYERLYVRSDLFFRKTISPFQATYKVVNQEWQSTARLETNTFNWMLAPQLHFFPNNLAYIFAGYLLEINTNSKFTVGVLDYFENNQPKKRDFTNETPKNTQSSAVIMGIGVHPRFNRVGVFAEIRYSRSRPSAVNNYLPRIGQENISIAGGITYDLR